MCSYTHYIGEPKKSLEIILDVRKIYFSRSTGKVLFRLIRQIKNSGSSGTCTKTKHTVRKNCSRPKNIEIESENVKSNIQA